MSVERPVVRETAAQRAYMTGFGNEHATEAESGALPIGRNSPQQAPHGLYAEKYSGTAFTAPKARNFRSWFYRIRPSVTTVGFEAVDNTRLLNAPERQLDYPTVWEGLKRHFARTGR